MLRLLNLSSAVVRIAPRAVRRTKGKSQQPNKAPTTTISLDEQWITHDREKPWATPRRSRAGLAEASPRHDAMRNMCQMVIESFPRLSGCLTFSKYRMTVP